MESNNFSFWGRDKSYSVSCTFPAYLFLNLETQPSLLKRWQRGHVGLTNNIASTVLGTGAGACGWAALLDEGSRGVCATDGTSRGGSAFWARSSGASWEDFSSEKDWEGGGTFGRVRSSANCAICSIQKSLICASSSGVVHAPVAQMTTSNPISFFINLSLATL